MNNHLEIDETYDKEISIENIQQLLKNIHIHQLRVNTPLSPQQNLLVEDINRLANDLYSDLRISKTDISIKGITNKKTDDEEIGELDSLKFNRIFNKDRELIYDLIAFKIFGRSKYTTDKTYNHIFYLPLYSKYCDKNEDFFIVKRNGEFQILDIQKLLPPKYSLKMFIKDFIGYSDKISDIIVNELARLYKDKSMTHEELQLNINRLIDSINEQVKSDFESNEGVITFCDFLGWKGLWKDKMTDHLQKASGLINRINIKMNQLVESKIPYSKNCPISRLISISDTIAILTPQISYLKKSEMIEIHAELAKYILQESVLSLFAIRGAITYGEYSFKGNIMIGPGVDESASWHEKSDWIGIILSPSTEFIIEDNLPKSIIKYDIPIKDKSPRVKYCIAWSVDIKNFDELVSQTKALIPEIASKYLNTRKFLKERSDGR